jgi:flagellar hook-associated protein 1 FlgK
MSIMGVLEIGSKGLAAQKTAIEVTGENISNVNTPGYSRQTVILESTPGGVDPRYPIGSGVKVAAIQRAHDAFLQAQIQTETSSNGKLTVLQDSLAKVEPLFNETVTSGLGASLQEFFNAWQDLSVNPQGTAERQAVLSKAQSVIDDFHRVNQSLNDQVQQANQSLTGLTDNITSKLKQIAGLNVQIQGLEAGGGSANQLRDSRDRLLQELSQKVGISYREQSDGTLTVTLGSNSVGPSLVNGATSSILTVDTTNPNSSIILKRNSSDPGTDVTALISGDGKSGELGGTLQVRDKVLPGFIGKLDELGYNVASDVNTLHVTGTGLTGATGVNFFAPPANSSGYSGLINLNITSTSDIAAAGTPSGGTGDNRNALALAALKNKAITVSGSQTTLPGLYSSLVGAVGIAVQNSQQGVMQSSTMLKQLDSLRESSVGVSLDEELMKLMSFQKAYEGAAKLITTGQQMIDTVLNMVR